MYQRILLLSSIISIGICKVYDKCELAHELKDKHGVHGNNLATWVCIAYHESRYDTKAINHASGDHGIFQISELFWCTKDDHKRKACHISCNKLKDNDITDDFHCAKKIFKEHQRLQGNGFRAWVTYERHCSNGRANIFTEDCF